MCQPVNAEPDWKEINKADVLEFLRKNKDAERYVPEWITDNDVERITRISSVLKDWMKAKAPKQAIANIKKLLGSTLKNKSAVDKKQQLLEEKFKLENFDLIVWEYVMKNN